MFKLVKKYYSTDKTERKILNRTLIWLICAFVLVRFIPLRWFNLFLGEFKNQTEVTLNDKQIQVINGFRISLRRLKKYLPWKVKCFDEAIAGKKVLNKYEIKTTLFLGVTKEGEQNLKAHAWLKSGSIFVTGEKGYKRYAIVRTYS